MILMLLADRKRLRNPNINLYYSGFLYYKHQDTDFHVEY